MSGSLYGDRRAVWLNRLGTATSGQLLRRSGDTVVGINVSFTPAGGEVVMTGGGGLLTTSILPEYLPQNPNLFFAGPVSGGAATPAYRAMVPADLPVVAGSVVLVLGTATVNLASVTANSRIFLSVEVLGTITAPVAVAVTARTPGASFVITSANLTDTSTIAYLVVEP